MIFSFSGKHSWQSKGKKYPNFHESNFAYLHYSVAQQIWSFAREIIGAGERNSSANFDPINFEKSSDRTRAP